MEPEQHRTRSVIIADEGSLEWRFHDRVVVQCGRNSTTTIVVKEVDQPRSEAGFSNLNRLLIIKTLELRVTNDELPNPSVIRVGFHLAGGGSFGLAIGELRRVGKNPLFVTTEELITGEAKPTREVVVAVPDCRSVRLSETVGTFATHLVELRDNAEVRLDTPKLGDGVHISGAGACTVKGVHLPTVHLGELGGHRSVGIVDSCRIGTISPAKEDGAQWNLLNCEALDPGVVAALGNDGQPIVKYRPGYDPHLRTLEQAQDHENLIRQTCPDPVLVAEARYRTWNQRSLERRPDVSPATRFSEGAMFTALRALGFGLRPAPPLVMWVAATVAVCLIFVMADGVEYDAIGAESRLLDIRLWRDAFLLPLGILGIGDTSTGSTLAIEGPNARLARLVTTVPLAAAILALRARYRLPKFTDGKV